MGIYDKIKAELTSTTKNDDYTKFKAKDVFEAFSKHPFSMIHYYKLINSKI